MEEENLENRQDLCFMSAMDILGGRWERGDKLPGEMIKETDSVITTNADGENSERCVGGESKEISNNDHNAFPDVGGNLNVQDKIDSDKSNAESDMDIGSNDADSDPEFLAIKSTNESSPNVSSFGKDSKAAVCEAPISESEETEVNEDFLSYIFAPEDMIVECQDKKNFFYCNVCHCNIHNSTKNIKVHKKGKSHKAAMIKYKKAVVTAAKNLTALNKPGAFLTFLDCYVERYKPRGYYCRVCNFIAEKVKVMDDHVHGKWHETNICIMKEREKMAQSKESIEKGTQDEMKELDEDFFKLLEMNRLHSWNSYSSAIAEDASKNKTTFKMESDYSTQDPSLYSSHNDFQLNQYYQNYPCIGNEDLGNDQQAASFPYSQQMTEVPVSSQLQENASLLNTHFVIKNESHAQVVIEVIDSLLQTYLKHKLRGLSKLHFKLPYRSLEREESTYHAHSGGIGRVTEQDFRDSQNSKNKYQSSFFTNSQRRSFDLHSENPNKYIENRSSKRMYPNETFYNEKSQGIQMDSKTYNSFCIEEENHYEPYYEERTVTSRRIDSMRQYEHNFSQKENESTFDELLPFGCYNEDGSTKRTRYNQSYVDDSDRNYSNYNDDNTLPHFARQNQSTTCSSLEQDENSVYEDLNEQNKLFMNNTNKQYRNFKKENNFARNNRRQFYARDFSENYNKGSDIGERFSRGTHQKFRSSNNFTQN